MVQYASDKGGQIKRKFVKKNFAFISISSKPLYIVNLFLSLYMYNVFISIFAK